MFCKIFILLLIDVLVNLYFVCSILFVVLNDDLLNYFDGCGLYISNFCFGYFDNSGSFVGVLLLRL